MLDGSDLREALQAILPAHRIREQSHELGVVERNRKLEVVPLVYALVLSAGSDDSGRLADAYRRYLERASSSVVRGSFYEWMSEPFAKLMEALLTAAVAYVDAQPAFLPGVLSGVDDWLVFDSETVTLRDALHASFPASGSAAGVKVHKELSVGRGGMVAWHFSPAREHDSPHLKIGERYRGKGLLVDLGYASHQMIRDCQRHGVKYVIRLKENWKPRVERVALAQLTRDVLAGADLDDALIDGVIVMRGDTIDCDVVLGRGRKAVRARLVGVALPANEKGEIPYRFYLTNLPRQTHRAQDVSDLYRVRWEIEGDNKLDKSGARLDQIRATTAASVRIQLCAALLHSVIADILMHRSLVRRAQEQQPKPSAPLHRLLVAHALRSIHTNLRAALLGARTPAAEWHRLARYIATQGHDPNWRARPSVLDRLRGIDAQPGRKRRVKLADSPDGSAPLRSAKLRTNCPLQQVA